MQPNNKILLSVTSMNEILKPKHRPSPMSEKFRNVGSFSLV